METALYVAIAGLMLGVAHGMEPDHLATISLSGRGAKAGLMFGVAHGIGFILLSLPLILILHYMPNYRLITDVAAAVSIVVGAVALYSSLRGLDLEIGTHLSQGLGLLQGALAVTPTKILLIALAVTTNIYMGLASLLLFTAGSVTVMTIYGYARPAMPKGLERVVTMIVSAASIAYALFMLM